MLKLENISVDIAGIKVLRAVSAELREGTTIAIVGRNGAGKTTLLRTIMGLVKTHSGRIALGNDELLSMPAHRRAALGIGYAPEERIIYPTLTVEENLRMPCEVQGLSETDIAARLESVIDVVPQLKEMLNRSGAALSGGQGKMVALGRALMIGSRLVLLDEPLQGLAPVLAMQYAESVGRLRKIRPDLCIVITESNASLLANIPDQTLVLERGSLSVQTEALHH